jgi:hypothetical protein
VIGEERGGRPHKNGKKLSTTQSSSIDSTTLFFFCVDVDSMPTALAVLQVGDVDLDGFPDVLLWLESINGGPRLAQVGFVVLSVFCCLLCDCVCDFVVVEEY